MARDFVPTFTQGATLARSEMSGKDVWVGWLHDGRRLQQFAPRSTRDRALQDAAQHRERLMNPEMPDKVWRPDA